MNLPVRGLIVHFVARLRPQQISWSSCGSESRLRSGQCRYRFIASQRN
jgi:hypothetical protein